MDKIRTVEIELEDGAVYNNGNGIPFVVDSHNVIWNPSHHFQNVEGVTWPTVENTGLKMTEKMNQVSELNQILNAIEADILSTQKNSPPYDSNSTTDFTYKEINPMEITEYQLTKSDLLFLKRLRQVIKVTDKGLTFWNKTCNTITDANFE